MKSTKRRLAPRISHEVVVRNIKFLELEESACAPGAERILFERYISYLAFKYDRTGNPCFVWEAIKRIKDRAVNDFKIKAIGSHDAIMRLTTTQQVNLELEAEAHIQQINLSLPSWCMSYLVNSASLISILSKKLDIAQLPEIKPRKYLESFNEWVMDPTLSNGEAIARVDTTLGFTKRGKNVFSQQRSEHVSLNFEQIFQYKLMKNLGANEAYAEIAEELDMDLRAVQRRIRAGKRLIRELESFLQGGSG
jgi:hypothetical protein